jgi:hypothetical protein
MARCLVVANTPMFTPHVRDHLPLELLIADLARRSEDRGSYLEPETVAAFSDEFLVEHCMTEWDHRFPPAVVAEVRPAAEPWRRERRGRHAGDPVDHLSVWRWCVEFRIAGQTETLTRWPAYLAEEPCGEDLHLQPIPWVFWQREGNLVAAYFDVPYEDDPDGTSMPSDRIRRGTVYLHAAAEAANAEVADRRALAEAALRQQIANRRRRLVAIEGQVSDLVEHVREQFGSIEVVRVEDAALPPAVAEGADGDEIVLNYVVSDGSFERFIAVTRLWASGAERYPDAFGPLEEEVITSVLVSALNVAFDAAAREVFQGQGKTDLFVWANLGTAGEAAHVGEAKIWGGQQRVHSGSAGKPGDVEQLLGYATSRTTQMLLIYYVRQKQRGLIEDRAVGAIGECDGFDRWEQSDEARVAVFSSPRVPPRDSRVGPLCPLPCPRCPRSRRRQRW